MAHVSRMYISRQLLIIKAYFAINDNISISRLCYKIVFQVQRMIVYTIGK